MDPFLSWEVLDILSEPFFHELDRLRGIEGQVEWMDKELRLMIASLEQVKNEKPSDSVDKWAEEAEQVIRLVEDVIDIFFVKSARNTGRRGLFNFKWLKDVTYHLMVSRKLDKIKLQMRDISKTRPTSKQEQYPSLSQAQGSGITNRASGAVASVVEKINVVLPSIVVSGVIDHVIQIRDEFTKLSAIINDYKPEEELDDRAIVWMEGAKSAAEFAEKIFLSFSRKESFKSPFNIPFLHTKDYKLDKDMERINIKIQDLYETKWTYGIGDFEGREIPTSMVPIPKPLPTVKRVLDLYLHFLFFPGLRLTPAFWFSQFSAQLITKRSFEGSLWQPVDKQVQSIQGDLKLLHALVNDVDGMEYPDKRFKMWLAEMRDIERDAEELYRLANESRQGRVREIADRLKIAKMIKQIKKKIHDASERKWTYDIGQIEGKKGGLISGDQRIQEEETSTSEPDWRQEISIPAEAVQGPSHQSEQSRCGLECISQVIISFWLPDSDEELIMQVESIKSELKIMQAFFKDLESMEEPDARLKAWVGELQRVNESAQRLIESYNNNRRETRKVWKEIYRINNDICEISERKRTYDIGSIKRRRAVSTHQVEERRHGHGFQGIWSGFSEILMSVKKLEENVGWIKSELSLMRALFNDVEEMENLDYFLKVWVNLMREVAHDAQAAINDYIQITGQNPYNILKRLRVAKKIESIMDKIQDVSERRFVYGIDIIKSRDTAQTIPPVIKPRDLPLYLRTCFFYFGLFPVNFEIPVRRLIMLWVAEGLVRQVRGDKEPPESVAKRYLTELIFLKMVQVTEQKLNGEVKKCCLCHELQLEAKNANFLKVRTLKGSKSTLRLPDHYNPKDACFSHIHGNNTNPSASSVPADYKDVISFLSFDTREGSKPGEEVGNFLDRSISSGFFLSLRVLDLERVFRPQLPKTLGQLITLRYLGLRWTYLETLPSFISKLLKLQALDVKHTYISTLPSSIWKMEQLRHLYLNESYRCRFVRQPSRSYLTNLQTLWGAFIDEDSPIKNGLDTLTNLRKLGLACRIMSSQEEAMSSQLNAVADWLLRLKHLQSLRLKSYNELGKPGNLPLPKLTDHSSLSTIYLLGRLEKSSVVSEYPKNIVEITLSASGLAEEQEDPMQTLKDLPNLRILQLFSKAYEGKKMLCSPGGFPQLKVLKLWNLEQLEKWEVEIGALPNLEDLEIRSCVKLEGLSNGLQHVRTLKKLTLPKRLKQFMGKIGGQDCIEVVYDDSNFENPAETSFVHSSPIWKKLWMLNTHERRITFLWRIYSDSLPSELPIGSITCPICGSEPESAAHLFFLCKTAKMIWFSMWGIKTDVFSYLSISDWITRILNPSLIFGGSHPRESYFLHSAVIIMEKTWLWRNRCIFYHAEIEPDFIYNEILSASMDKLIMPD